MRSTANTIPFSCRLFHKRPPYRSTKYDLARRSATISPRVRGQRSAQDRLFRIGKVMSENIVVGPDHEYGKNLVRIKSDESVKISNTRFFIFPNSDDDNAFIFSKSHRKHIPRITQGSHRSRRCELRARMWRSLPRTLRPGIPVHSL